MGHGHLLRCQPATGLEFSPRANAYSRPEDRHALAARAEAILTPTSQTAMSNLELLLSTLILACGVLFLAAIGVWYWIEFS